LQYTPNYNLRKPGPKDVVNINDFNYNADTIDAALTPVVDPTLVPGSDGPAKLSEWISWLTYRIQEINGDGEWYDAVGATLAEAKEHIDSAAPHSGHVKTTDVVAASAPDKILRLDALGKFPVSVISGLAAIATSSNYSDLKNVPVNNKISISAIMPGSPAINDFWIDIG
jgi:hypothetical protein